MSEQGLKPRHTGGMVAIALLLGPPALMLWMGRLKFSLLYIAISVAAAGIFAFAVNGGLISPAMFKNFGLEVAVYAVSLPVAAISLFHALKLNKQPPIRPFYSRWFVALPVYIVVSFAIALFVRTFLYQPFSSPSSSSYPNLMVGDMFFVSKTAYRTSDPQRGDIAVFKLPSNPAVDYVKRVIGLPGDRIQMKQGRLYLNGDLISREAASYRPPADQPDEAADTFYRETLPNGRSYLIAERSDDSEADNTDEYVVPEGRYFALGDNRDNSQDSRFLDSVGYIPRANFTGPFAIRFWNTNGMPLTGRPEESPATR